MTSVVSPIFSSIHKGGFFTGTEERFSVEEHFSPRRSPVQISYVGEKFKEYFFGKVFPPSEGYPFTMYKLRCQVLDEMVMLDISRNYQQFLPTSPAFIWSRLLRQPYKGCPGYLADNGKPNVFHVGERFDIPRNVAVFWRDTFWDKEVKRNIEQGWNIRSYDPEEIKRRAWHQEGRIFVRNIVEGQTSRLTL